MARLGLDVGVVKGKVVCGFVWVVWERMRVEFGVEWRWLGVGVDLGVSAGG